VHLVHLRAARREHDDRHGQPRLPHRLERAEAVHPGEHEVEQHEGRAPCGGEPHAGLPVGRHLDGVPLPLEAAGEAEREVLVVLDDQDVRHAAR
jgi:hypothetical protein